MRHTGIAFTLSTLLLVSICSAQQTAITSQHTAPKAGNPANTTTLVGGPDTVVNCAQAQAGRIAMFTAATLSSVILCNSGIYEAQPYGSGAIGILNPHPAFALDITGDINVSGSLRFAGHEVLAVTLLGNLAVGPDTLSLNTGSENTGVGVGALLYNTSGIGNTAVGSGALSRNDIGYGNTAVGGSSLPVNMSGYANTVTGASAMSSNTNGDNNTATGAGTLFSNVSGSSNTAVGVYALQSITGGNNNIAIGYQAALNVSGSNSNNIDIGNEGLSSDNGSIRIGDPANQNAAYIAGIYGATSSSGVPVYVNSNGQLGTSPSSLRFKEQVRDMGNSTNALMKLRPVTFLYKPEYDKGERTLQYGLIAEEVAKVYPELVAYDNDGQPYTVRYQ